jgi:hypothetical protein
MNSLHVYSIHITVPFLLLSNSVWWISDEIGHIQVGMAETNYTVFMYLCIYVYMYIYMHIYVCVCTLILFTP